MDAFLAATLGAFAAGFGLGGAIAAFGVGIAPARLPRTGAACAGEMVDRAAVENG